jgi:cation:H+ antiporter
MHPGINILIIIFAAFILVKSVNFLVSALKKIARHFNVSPYVISFFLVALATSLPETLVAITSALAQKPILSFGNALGANITMMTLVAGISAIYARGISTRNILNSKDAYFAGLFLLLPLFLIIDGTLSRLDGLFLLTAYIFYTLKILQRGPDSAVSFAEPRDKNILKQIIIFFGASVAVIASSQFIVIAAIDLSNKWVVGLGFIGLTITALGTSLPEMTFSLASIKKGVSEQVLGNALGSIVANSTFVIGLAAIIYPIDLAGSAIGVPTITFLILVLLLFLRFSRTKQKIEMREGFLLVCLYVVFVVMEYGISQGLVF